MTTTPTLRDAAQALADAYDESPYHRPDGAFRGAVDILRAALAAPADTTGLAHEIWAVAQLGPGEGIEDGVARIAALLPGAPADALAEPVAWGIWDSQGFYDWRPDEKSAKEWCERYNSRSDGDPLKPYTCAPLYSTTTATGIEEAVARVLKLTATGNLTTNPFLAGFNVGINSAAAAIRAKGQQ